MTRRTGRHASFNPRARTGRDRCCTSALRLAPCFNPRARVGRDGAPDQPEAVTLGFNPRARVGRDDAAAWRSKVSSMFQSTRPRGARQSHRRRWCRAAFVSIHAPAWGATPKRDGAFSEPFRFNPRARVGRDREDVEDDADELQFQSTRPRGARPQKRPAMFMTSRFQSTRPRGARLVLEADLNHQVEFQSTRPRGARRRAGPR